MPWRQLVRRKSAGRPFTSAWCVFVASPESDNRLPSWFSRMEGYFARPAIAAAPGGRVCVLRDVTTSKTGRMNRISFPSVSHARSPLTLIRLRTMLECGDLMTSTWLCGKIVRVESMSIWSQTSGPGRTMRVGLAGGNNRVKNRYGSWISPDDAIKEFGLALSPHRFTEAIDVDRALPSRRYNCGECH